jgi:hypothetical protein
MVPLSSNGLWIIGMKSRRRGPALVTDKPD